TGLQVLKLLALVGIEMSIVVNIALQSLLNAGKLGLVRVVSNIWLQVKDRRDQTVGAEDTSELGVLAEVHLTTCSNAGNRVQEPSFVLNWEDPADVRFVTAKIGRAHV